MNGQVDRRRTFRKSQVLCLRGEKVRKEEKPEIITKQTPVFKRLFAAHELAEKHHR